MEKKLNIFMSYAKEDFKLVESFYNKLRNLGLNPWIDKKNILPGVDWEKSIWKAVKEADIVLIFLSKSSTIKRGFLQKEIKRVLDLWEEKLEDDIFLIPIRIEECDVPVRLSKFQYLDIFEQGGFDKLLASLNFMLKRLGLPPTPKVDNYTIVTNKIHDRVTKGLSYEYDIEYPVIKYNPIFERVNKNIEIFINSRVNAFRKKGDRIISDEGLVRHFSNSAMQQELSITYQVQYIDKDYLSMEFNIWEYGIGAAHSIGYFHPFNFSVQTTKDIKIEEIFEKNSNWLLKLSSYCRKDLCKQVDIIYPDNNEDFKNVIESIENGTEPKLKNFSKFLFSKEYLIILFDIYQVGCFAEGQKKVKIPYSYIIDSIKKVGPIRDIIRNNINN